MDLKPNACLSVVSSSAILQMHNIAIFFAHTCNTCPHIFSSKEIYINRLGFCFCFIRFAILFKSASTMSDITSTDSSRFDEGLASLARPLSHLGEMVLDQTLKDAIKPAIALVFDHNWSWDRLQER